MVGLFFFFHRHRADTYLGRLCGESATVDRAHVRCVPLLVRIQKDQSKALRQRLERGIGFVCGRVCVYVLGGLCVCVGGG